MTQSASGEMSRILLDQADRLFQQHITKEQLAEADAGTWPTAMWDAVEKAGLPLAMAEDPLSSVVLGAVVLGPVMGVGSFLLPRLLGGVRAPALIVWGDDDQIVPRSAGELYAKSLPNARLETVAASGHCVDMEQPDALARLVTSFVEEN